MKNTQKQKKSIISKTRSKRNSNRICITVDFSKKDKGYSDLLQPKLLSFIVRNIKEGNNLLQTQDDKTFVVYKKNKLYLQSVPVKKWKQTPEWKDIECNEINEYMKATPCNIGTNTKLFYKVKSTPTIGGLASYIMGLSIGLIDEVAHKRFVQALQTTFKKRKVRIHNEDVDWFHLKESQ